MLPRAGYKRAVALLMGIRVVFEVSCPTVNFEEVRVVGSHPELGAWDPLLAVPLKTSEQQYPLWRTAELLLPIEVVQYKYLKVLGGAVQWEAGPHRILDVGCLSNCMVNVVEDMKFDADAGLAQRSTSGARIRFQEPSKSQMTSLGTSRLASSVPSPLRTSAGPTPVEKSPCCMGELEGILRELLELESMNLAGHAEIRRAAAAVRSAIEAERSGGRYRFPRRARCCTCTGLAFLMVPILPLIVALSIFHRVPSARRRSVKLAEKANAWLASAWPTNIWDGAFAAGGFALAPWGHLGVASGGQCSRYTASSPRAALRKQGRPWPRVQLPSVPSTPTLRALSMVAGAAASVVPRRRRQRPGLSAEALTHSV